MIEQIEELETKGFRVVINPIKENQWYWRGGVYVPNDTRITWVDTKNGLPKATYNSYREAFNAVIDYCAKKKG